MEISEVKVRRIYKEGRMRAIVSISLDQQIAIHDIKVIEHEGRRFVAMPSRKEEDGTHRDIVHPITSEMRQTLEQAVLSAFDEEVRRREQEEELK